MMITIDLPDDIAEAVKSQAAAQGLSVEAWLRKIAVQYLRLPGAGQENRHTRRRISEVIADIVGDASAEQLERLPRDGASQIDHYVYGLPKREE